MWWSRLTEALWLQGVWTDLICLLKLVFSWKKNGSFQNCICVTVDLHVSKLPAAFWGESSCQLCSGVCFLGGVISVTYFWTSCLLRCAATACAACWVCVCSAACLYWWWFIPARWMTELEGRCVRGVLWNEAMQQGGRCRTCSTFSWPSEQLSTSPWNPGISVSTGTLVINRYGE